MCAAAIAAATAAAVGALQQGRCSSMEEPGAAVQLNVALLVARLMWAVPVILQKVRPGHHVLARAGCGCWHAPAAAGP